MAARQTSTRACGCPEGAWKEVRDSGDGILRSAVRTVGCRVKEPACPVGNLIPLPRVVLKPPAGGFFRTEERTGLWVRVDVATVPVAAERASQITWRGRVKPGAKRIRRPRCRCGRGPALGGTGTAPELHDVPSDLDDFVHGKRLIGWILDRRRQDQVEIAARGLDGVVAAGQDFGGARQRNRLWRPLSRWLGRRRLGHRLSLIRSSGQGRSDHRLGRCHSWRWTQRQRAGGTRRILPRRWTRLRACRWCRWRCCPPSAAARKPPACPTPARRLRWCLCVAQAGVFVLQVGVAVCSW